MYVRPVGCACAAQLTIDTASAEESEGNARARHAHSLGGDGACVRNGVLDLRALNSSAMVWRYLLIWSSMREAFQMVCGGVRGDRTDCSPVFPQPQQPQ